MKTTSLLMDSETYLDGSPSFKGDIGRMFTSQLNVVCIAKIVKAPEGAKTIIETQSDVIQTMKKIPFGQIGAVYDDVSLPAQTVVSEFIVPVKFDEIVNVHEEILNSHTINDKLKTLQFKTRDGGTVSFDEIKSQLEPYRENNQAIRKSWVQKSNNLRTAGASSEDIIQAKKEHYAEYIAPAGYCLVISFEITHIVNDPSLKATIRENMTQDEYNRLAYNTEKVRKKATHRLPLITIPLQSVEQYLSIRSWYQSYVSGGNKIVSVPYYAVIHEGDKLNGVEVDFNALREHDRSISRK